VLQRVKSKMQSHYRSVAEQTLREPTTFQAANVVECAPPYRVALERLFPKLGASRVTESKFMARPDSSSFALQIPRGADTLTDECYQVFW
jgi:hypothetical protein